MKTRSGLNPTPALRATFPHVSKVVWGVALVLLLVMARPVASVDTLTGEVVGRIRDLSGQFPVIGARLTLRNLNQGWSRLTFADVEGRFEFSQLEPGSYEVLAEHAGYLPRRVTGILVRLNLPKLVVPPIELRREAPTLTQVVTARSEQVKTLAIDLTLPPPPQAEIETLIEGERTSMLTLHDASLRTNFDALLLSGLPLAGGRSFDDLALLVPGVARTPASSGTGPAVGIGVGSPGQFSVNGMRSRSNNFTIDGSDNNDEDVGIRRQGFVSPIPQSIESLADFQIMTAGFPAEFGRNAGAVVNAVTRSGDRDFRMDAYGIVESRRLASRGSYDRPFEDRTNTGHLNGGSYRNPDRSRSIAGATAGGRLWSDRWFYFGAGEYQDRGGTSIGHFVVPGPNDRGLRIRDPEAQSYGFIPIERLGAFLEDRSIPHSDLVGRSVFSLYPLPNNPGGPFGAHTYSQVRQSGGSSASATVKIGWHSNLQSASGRYSLSRDDSTLPFTGDSINSSIGTRTRIQNVSLSWFWSGTVWANSARFSYGRTLLAFPSDKGDSMLFGSSPSAHPFPRDFGSPPAAFGRAIETRYGRFGPFGATGPVGQLAIVPFSSIGVDVFNFPQGRTDNAFQYADLVTQRMGSHTLKYGFDIRRSQLNNFVDRNSRPLLIFGSGLVGSSCLANPFCVFATDDGRLRGTDLASLGGHAGFLQSVSTEPGADTSIGLRVLRTEFFAQDEWKPLRNLNVSMGLRFEPQFTPSEVNRRIESALSFDPGSFSRLQPSGSAVDRQIIARANDNFDRALRSLTAYLNGRATLYESGFLNLAPRLGIAWDPTGSGRTVIRAGYSMAFDASLGAFTSQARNLFPRFVPVNLDLNFSPTPPSGVLVNNATFFTFVPTQSPLIQPGTLNTFNLREGLATGLGALLGQGLPSPERTVSGNGLAFTLPERRLRTAYGQHFVVSASQQAGNDLAVSVSYVGTRGIRLPRAMTPNGGLISTPELFVSADRPVALRDRPPFFSTTGGRPVTGLGAFTQLENSAASTFHSLQLSGERRFRDGLQFRAGWTWSHAIDDVSDPFDGRGFFALPEDQSRLRSERADANFDVRHRWTGLVMWDVPRFMDAGWTEGWRVALTGERQTGQPYTVNSTIDRNGDGNLTDRPSGQGRNAARAEGLSVVHASVSRRIFLGESSAVELRVDAFNVLNSANPGVPVRILESPGFGRPFDSNGPPRTVRIGLKVAF